MCPLTATRVDGVLSFMVMFSIFFANTIFMRLVSEVSYFLYSFDVLHNQ